MSAQVQSSDDTLTVAAGAREFPWFTPEYLRRQIRAGRLPAEKDTRGYQIRRADLEALPRPVPGRPTDRDRRETLARATVAQAHRFTPEQAARIVAKLAPVAAAMGGAR